MVIHLVFPYGVLDLPGRDLCSVGILVEPSQLHLAPPDMLLTKDDDPLFFFRGDRSFSSPNRSFGFAFQQSKILTVKPVFPDIEDLWSNRKMPACLRGIFACACQRLGLESSLIWAKPKIGLPTLFMAMLIRCFMLVITPQFYWRWRRRGITDVSHLLQLLRPAMDITQIVLHRR